MKLIERELMISHLKDIEEYIQTHLSHFDRPDSLGLRLPPALPSFVREFVDDCYTWLKLVNNQPDAASIDILNSYLDRLFAALSSLCKILDEEGLRRYAADLWYFNDMLGEMIPWDLLTEDYRQKQASAIFQHKAFRDQFIAFYTGGAFVHNLGTEEKPKYFARARVCSENLLSFLRGWDCLKDRAPIEEVNAGNELALHQKSALQKSGSYLQLEKVDHEAKPKKESTDKKATLTTTTGKALSKAEEASEKLRRVELLDDEETEELDDAMRLATTAALRPSRSAVKDLTGYGEKFQSKSSPLWKALGLALLGLALTIAGALTIAVSVGAIHTGFFAPPGVGGVFGGIALIEAGVTSLTMAAVSLLDGSETETCDTNMIKSF